jgi:hypothetical protein
MSSILLLIISLAAPWVVQMAPPRQRPVALVAVIAVLLLFGIFSGNPITQWQFWVGLIIGITHVCIGGAAVLLGGGRTKNPVQRK